MDDSRAAADQGRREEVATAASNALVALPRRVVIARQLLAIAAWLLAAAVLVQIFLAGRALFIGPDLWQRHRDFVHTFEWLSPVSVVLAYVGRAPRRAKWLAWATVVLLFFAYATAGWQSSLGKLGLAAIHPVIAALLFWSAIELARQTKGSESLKNDDGRERVIGKRRPSPPFNDSDPLK